MTTSHSQHQGLARFPWLPESIAEVLATVDWPQRPLGPPEAWPRDLDPLLQLCLLSSQPIALVWGADGGHIFNQAWAESFAAGKWEAIGHAFAESWTPVWEECEQICRQAAADGSVSPRRARVFVPDEAGRPRERFFNVAATALTLAGMEARVILISAEDISRDCFAARRMRILHSLATGYRELSTIEANCQWFLDALVRHEAVVPLAAAYWVEESKGRARRLCCSGPSGTAAAMPEEISLKSEGKGWRFLDAIANSRLKLVSPVPEQLGIRFSTPYPEAIQTFAVYPIVRRGHNFPPAVLVMAASPRLALDAEYRSFFALLGIAFRQLMTGTYTRRRWEEANAALIASEGRYRAILEGQSEMVCRFRPDGTILFANGAYARAVDVPPDEIENRNFWDFVAADDRADVEAMLDSITPDSPEVNIENEFEIDGEYRWTRWTNRGLGFDDKGRLVEVQSVGMDISDRRRAEIALKDREEQLRLALQGANAGAWSMEVASGATFWSQQFRSLYGFDADTEPRFSTWIERIHPDDQTWVKRSFRARPQSTQSDYYQEFRIVHPERGERWLLGLGRVERDGDGQARLISGINIDITERKTVEQALRDSEERLKEADRRKDEFLATLAHELRNPLAPIRNSLEVMRLAGDDKQAVSHARAVMERQLAHMVLLINDLLDLSRISRGKVTLRRAPVPIAAIVEHAVELCRPMVDEGGHQLKLSLPEESIYVDADRVRLAQVFANLLSNAIKFTRLGGEISLTVDRVNEQVVVRVRDEGVGIAAHMLDKIFEMFIQADANQHSQGLGIGLSLVKGLVEMHGGEVQAHSAGQGKGSEFVVRLPVIGRGPMQNGADTLEHQSHAGGRLRVLVVDDNQDAATSMATMLDLMGHDTRVAFDGLAALDVAPDFRPDVVLLDIGMPQLNGYETARRLRQQKWARGINLVALTGWGQAEDRRRSRAAGFDHHLVKPVDLAALSDLLSAAGPDNTSI